MSNANTCYLKKKKENYHGSIAMHAMCLARLCNESHAATLCNVRRENPWLYVFPRFDRSRCESSALGYRTFTIDPFNPIVRFAFPYST